MSRIPIAVVQGGVVSPGATPLQSLDVAQQLSSGASLEAIGRGLAVTRQVAEKMQEARDTLNVSQQVNDVSLELDKIRGELDNDPNYAGRRDKFDARALQARDNAMSKLSSPGARQDFELRFNRLHGSMGLQIQHEAREGENQAFRLQLGEQLDGLANRAVFARSPQEREVFQTEALTAITEAVRTQRLSATGANGLRKAYVGKVDAALASEQVRLNPSAAIAALGDPTKFPNLDAAARVQLRAQAQQRAESLGAQASAELRADIHDYQTARQSGQAVPPEVEADILRRAGGKSKLGQAFVRARDFYNRVDTETTGQSIPQLQQRISDLEGGGQRKTWDGYAARRNNDGSVSTELTITVTDPKLNNGKPTNIPSLWEGKELDQAAAIDKAAKSGRQWQGYNSIDDAVQAAVQRSNELGQGGKGPTLDDLNVSRALKTALDRKVTERDRDPAAYALKYNPTVSEQLAASEEARQSNDAIAQAQADDLRRAAWAAMLDAQRREGVPEHRLSLMTKPSAEALKAKLFSAEGQDRVDLIDNLRTTYGDQWNRVKSQLGDGKPLPPDLEVVANLPQGANVDRVMLTEAFKLSDQKATELLGASRIKDIDESVRSRGSEMVGTLAQAPDGPQWAATYQNAAEKLARLYVVRGDSVGRATERAFNQVFYDHWEVVGTARVPKQQGRPVVEASAVRAAQAGVLDVLDRMDLSVPDQAEFPGTTPNQRKQMLVRNARSFGFWMTGPNDDGMYLMAGPGLPVRFADGQPLFVPFDSVSALAANRQADRNLRARYAPEGEYVDQGSDPGPGFNDPLTLPGTTLENVRRARRQAPASPTDGVAP